VCACVRVSLGLKSSGDLRAYGPILSLPNPLCVGTLCVLQVLFSPTPHTGAMVNFDSKVRDG
jgi:hypothetical protein